MNTELKKCPFCGGEAKLYMKEDVCFLYCSECDCQARQCETVEEAIEAWNTRKPIDKVVEQLERAKGKFKGGTLQEHYYCMGINEAISVVKKGGGSDDK